MGPLLFLAGVVCLLYALAVFAGHKQVAASKPLSRRSPLLAALVALAGLVLTASGTALLAGWL